MTNNWSWQKYNLMKCPALLENISFQTKHRDPRFKGITNTQGCRIQDLPLISNNKKCVSACCSCFSNSYSLLPVAMETCFSLFPSPHILTLSLSFSLCLLTGCSNSASEEVLFTLKRLSIHSGQLQLMTRIAFSSWATDDAPMFAMVVQITKAVEYSCSPHLVFAPLSHPTKRPLFYRTHPSFPYPIYFHFSLLVFALSFWAALSQNITCNLDFWHVFIIPSQEQVSFASRWVMVMALMT